MTDATREKARGEAPTPLDLRSAWDSGVPPVDWLAKPWIVAGEVHNVIGQGGVGKSILCLDMALGMATGTTILGDTVSVAGARRVIYFDREQSYHLHDAWVVDPYNVIAYEED